MVSHYIASVLAYNVQESLGVNFWSRHFLGFWFLPPFNHPCHLKSWVPPGCRPRTARRRTAEKEREVARLRTWSKVCIVAADRAAWWQSVEVLCATRCKEGTWRWFILLGSSTTYERNWHFTIIITMFTFSLTLLTWNISCLKPWQEVLSILRKQCCLHVGFPPPSHKLSKEFIVSNSSTACQAGVL